MTRELGIDQHCVHLLDRADMQDLYGLCDVTMLTSVREGTPNVVLESMACGVPVIATDVADNAQIIGDAGAVVRLDDDESMARHVIAVLRDATLRRELASRARERAVREFSLDQLARKTERVYLEALRRRSPIRYRRLVAMETHLPEASVSRETLACASGSDACEPELELAC
jgi:glycosyltransferase involved in cell wall biosynthesis